MFGKKHCKFKYFEGIILMMEQNFEEAHSKFERMFDYLYDCQDILINKSMKCILICETHFKTKKEGSISSEEHFIRLYKEIHPFNQLIQAFNNKNNEEYNLVLNSHPPQSFGDQFINFFIKDLTQKINIKDD